MSAARQYSIRFPTAHPPGRSQSVCSKLIDSINHLETIRVAAGLLRKRTPTNFSGDDRVEGGIDTYRAALTARKS